MKGIPDGGEVGAVFYCVVVAFQSRRVVYRSVRLTKVIDVILGVHEDFDLAVGRRVADVPAAGTQAQRDMAVPRAL